MTGRVMLSSWALALVSLAALAAPRQASADVIVPGDHPTIQAALDAGELVIHVRTGRYPETLRIPATGGSEILIDAYAKPGSFAPLSYPEIEGLQLTEHGTQLTLVGMRVRRPVRIESSVGSMLRFESCRFDSGLVTLGSGSDGQFVYLRGCTVYGGAHLEGAGVQIYGCTVVGSGMHAASSGFCEVVGNYVTGPAPWGVRASYNEPCGLAQIRANVISGTETGIMVMDHAEVLDNEISGCTLDGVALAEVRGGASADAYMDCTNNRIRDCGRSGIRVATRSAAWDGRVQVDLTDNRIERTGEDGILLNGFSYLTGNVILDAGRHGVFADSTRGLGKAHGNTVLRARGDGMCMQAVCTIDSNVVGRCGGDGLVIVPVSEPGWHTQPVSHNTVYENHGSGIVVGDLRFEDPRHGYTAIDVVQFNIAYGNGRYGLDWTGTVASKLGCNDYYANALGMTSGVAPEPGDMSIEPLFCDVTRDDITLRGDSPLLHAPGCPPIGAAGVGCAALVGMQEPSLGGALAFAVAPQPASGEVSFGWRAQAEPARLEVFDIAGARRLDVTLPPAKSAYRWSGRDAEGAAIRPGVYYARLSSGAQAERHTVVLLR